MSADGSGDTRRIVVRPLRNKSLLLVFWGDLSQRMAWAELAVILLHSVTRPAHGVDAQTTSTIKKTGYVLPFIYSWLLFKNGEEVLLLVPMT